MPDYDAHTPITTEQRLTLPLNGSIFQTTRTVPTEKPVPKKGETMEGEFGGQYATNVILESSVTPNKGQRQLQITHCKIPPVEEQLASNWEWSEINTAIGALKGVARTYIYLTSEFSETSPALASAMPIYSGTTVPAGAVTGQFTNEDGYILFSRDVVSSGTQLEPIYRVERCQYIKRKIVTSIGVDAANGNPLYATVELRHRDEIQSGSTTYGQLLASPSSSYWGLQTNGTQRTARPATDEWIEITTEQVVSGTFSGGIVAVQNYNTTRNFYWPPVLNALRFLAWPRRDGGVETYPNHDYSKPGYNGPCKAVITRTWSKTPQAIDPPEQMLPTPIHYSSPYFNVNLPECLHAAVTCVCDIGTADPVYVFGDGSSVTTPRTNFLTWPDTILDADTQEPYRGGYLRTRIVIHKPDNSLIT